ncbi:MAG: carboxypeptidase regulatory-like domain-containing protein, partial [Candidatus Aminicenantes bacterium]|nr:carboxypeptidase regulatory-like domain-containing protein [Candidatus Aminicenantes bacterium]
MPHELCSSPSRKLRSRWIALIPILLAAFLPVAAQVLTSRVDGTVRDQSGAVLPGVSVTLTNADTNAAMDAVTSDIGLFVFPQVPRGIYGITAQLPGFKTAVVEGVRVELDTPASVDVVLEVGGVDEQVTVSAALTQAVINQVNAEINTNLNREQVKELPLNGRSVTQLALTQAGVTSVGGARTASINGTRGTFNNFTLDGINNQDTFIRTDSLFGVIPVRESFIEEINITTANSEVDAGMGASQTQFVTRSGTNEYHGELYYYHLNDALNATDFFNNAAGVPKERILNHQYGFSLGGPILKDK